MHVWIVANRAFVHVSTCVGVYVCFFVLLYPIVLNTHVHTHVHTQRSQHSCIYTDGDVYKHLYINTCPCNSHVVLLVACPFADLLIYLFDYTHTAYLTTGTKTKM